MDRLDRRWLIVVVNVLRGLVVGVLALAVWQDVATIPVVYAAGFLLGTCETLGDNASGTLVPMVVKSEDLPRANARMQTVFFAVNQFAAPPLGAALFVMATALPFGINAVTFVLAAALISTLRGVRRAAPAERRSVRADIGEGLRWLWNHSALRMLTVTLFLMNITYLAGFSILVLYSRDRLGLDEYGYGILIMASAVGSLVGAMIAPRLQARFSDSMLLRVGLVIETLTHVGLALAGTVWVAGPVLIVFGVHCSIWGAVSVTLRQRVVPDELRGRVQSVYMMFAVGGSALGALVGGLIARWIGITGPFWVSAVVMVVLMAVAWRPFGRLLVSSGANRREDGHDGRRDSQVPWLGEAHGLRVSLDTASRTDLSRQAQPHRTRHPDRPPTITLITPTSSYSRVKVVGGVRTRTLLVAATAAHAGCGTAGLSQTFRRMPERRTVPAPTLAGQRPAGHEPQSDRPIRAARSSRARDSQHRTGFHHARATPVIRLSTDYGPRGHDHTDPTRLRTSDNHRKSKTLAASFE